MQKETKLNSLREWCHNGISVVYDSNWNCWRQKEMPGQASLRSYYEEQYFQSEKQSWEEEKSSEREYWERHHKDKYDQIEQLIAGKLDRRIIDVGCGNGMFLEFMQRNGWNVQGVEPSPMAQIARDVRKVPCERVFVEDYHLPCENQFQVCHTSGVLEHVSDPEQFIGKCKSFMKPEGIFVIDHGLDFNEFQLAAVEYLKIEPWWIVPEHLTYWTDNQLSSLLERNGFKILHKQSEFPIDIFLLMGLDYVSEPRLGTQAHKMRVSFDRVLESTGRSELRTRFLSALASVGIGRSITYYCELMTE